jgi:hypothetical protein
MSDIKREFGVIMQLTSAQIVTHCQKRAEHHSKRAAFYLKKADEISGERREVPNPTFDDDDSATGYGKMSNRSSGIGNDPVAELHTNAMHHRSKAERFRFIATAIIPDHVFYFTLSQLNEIEIG